MATEEKKMTIREWRAAYKAGEFTKDFEGMVKAGWYDWFCSSGALLNRMKSFVSLVNGITNDFILDNYYIWFKNNCPISGPLYDDIRFEPLDESRRFEFYFCISRADKREKTLWCVYDDSNDFNGPVFGTDKVKELIDYINAKTF